MGKAKLNIPMCAALILLFLTMLSIHLTSGLYARYAATTTGGDSARVAKFLVTGTGSGDVTVDSVQDDAGNYTLTVHNRSEVAVKYSVAVVFTEAIDPTMLLLQLSGTDGTLSADGKTLDFGYQGDLAPNAPAVTKTLTFTVLNWDFVTGDAGTNLGETASKTLNFTVRITAEQID